MVSYRDTHSFENRKSECDKIKSRFIDRIPVIIECDDKIKLEKHKYLVHQDTSVGHFMCILRNKVLNVKETDGLYLFIGNKLYQGSATLLSVYNLERDDDGFLYMKLHKEATFG